MATNAYTIMHDQHGIRLVRYVNLYDRETYTLYIHAPGIQGMAVEYGIYTDLELAMDAVKMVSEQCDAPYKQDLLCVRLSGREDPNR